MAEEEPEHFRLGRRLQQPIADEVAERFKLALGPAEREFIHPRFPHLIAHCDYTPCDVDGGLWLLEIKATSMWSPAWQGLEPDEIATSVLTQVTFQAALMNANGFRPDRVVVARLHGMKVSTFDVAIDYELGDLLLEAGDRFYRENVLANVPPPLDERAGGEYLKRRFPKGNGRVRPATDSERLIAMRYAEAKQRVKEATAEADEWRLKLEAAIGEWDGLEGVARCVVEGASTAWKKVAEAVVARPTDAEVTEFAATLRLAENTEAEREAAATAILEWNDHILRPRLEALSRQFTKAKGRTLRLLGEKEES